VEACCEGGQGSPRAVVPFGRQAYKAKKTQISGGTTKQLRLESKDNVLGDSGNNTTENKIKNKINTKAKKVMLEAKGHHGRILLVK